MKSKAVRLIILALATLLILTSCAGSSASVPDEIVLKIDGQEITRSEYMYSLYNASTNLVSSFGEAVWDMDFDGRTADALAEEQAVYALQNLVLAKKYAAENNVTLSDAEKEEAKLYSEQFINVVPKEDWKKMGLTKEKLTVLVETSYLYSAVYEAIFEELVIDDAEIASFFEKNKADLMDEFQLLKVNSIVVDDIDTAKKVLEKARAGENFSALFNDYDVVGNVAGEGADGEMTVYRYYLESEFGLSESAKKGDIEGPFNMGSTYFILKIAEEMAPDEAEVKKMSEEAYRTNMKAFLMDQKMTELVAGQTVEKIDSVLATLEKFH